MRTILYSLLACQLACFVHPLDCSAYLPDNTHPLINDKAARLSNTDTYIKNHLGFSNGVETWFGNKKAIDWIKQGGTDEDANIRGLFHFHDPTKTWDQAGIWGLAFSSLDWAQDNTQGPVPSCSTVDSYGVSCPQQPPSSNPERSWPGARKFYYDALTSSEKTVRDEKFGKTFESLGHVMHLLADAAVPEHTRNDQHVMFPFESRYERWNENNQPAIASFIGIGNAPADYTTITNQSNVPGYSPISNFWDTTPTPGTTTSLLGLAEYTNYNFISPGTIFNSYANPVKPAAGAKRVEDVIGADGKHDLRIYFPATTSDGISISHFVSADYFWDDLSKVSPIGRPGWDFSLDDLCFHDHASILVPKAVSYSAGLLNYFFRGTIEISLPDKGVYGIIDNTAKPVDPNYKEILLKVRNTTSTSEEMSNGTIQLVVSYRLAESDTFVSGYVPSYGPEHIEYGQDGYLKDLYYLVVNASDTGITSIPTGTPVELTFNLPTDIDHPLSIKATDVRLQIVYRGRLGNEADAVAVGMNDISEPTPIGIANYMDYVCINGAWYAAGSPEALLLVDANHNGKADFLEGDIYPHGVTDIYFKFSSVNDTASATTSSYTAKLAGVAIPPGSIINHAVYILTDPYFTMSEKWTVAKTTSNDTFIELGSSPVVYIVDSVQRQDNWILPEYFESRGTTHWYFFAPVNRSIPSSGLVCSIGALEGVAPPFQSIP